MIEISCRNMKPCRSAYTSLNSLYYDLMRQTGFHDKRCYLLRRLLDAYGKEYRHTHVNIDVTFGLFYMIQNWQNYYDGPFYDACDYCIGIAIVNSIYLGLSNEHIFKEGRKRLRCLLGKKPGDCKDCFCANCPIKRIMERIALVYPGDLDSETFRKAIIDNV